MKFFFDKRQKKLPETEISASGNQMFYRLSVFHFELFDAFLVFFIVEVIIEVFED